MFQFSFICDELEFTVCLSTEHFQVRIIEHHAESLKPVRVVHDRQWKELQHARSDTKDGSSITIDPKHLIEYVVLLRFANDLNFTKRFVLHPFRLLGVFN